MDRLETMRVFVAVAEEEGFAPAARRLAMSAPAVTRAISALEKHLGTRLLQRTTRVVRLTDVGTRYLADARRILGDIDQAEASAASSQTELRGNLVVTAPLTFGRMFVAPIVLDFLARHPQVAARTVLIDHVVDLIEAGIDVGVRIAHLPDSSLTAARVGSVRRVICASPAFLAAHGTPRKVSDLASLDAVVFARDATQHQWVFGRGRKTEMVSLRSRFAVNTADVAVAAAVAGRGVARVLSYQIGPEVRAGKLRIVLPGSEPPPIPVSLVYPAGRASTARVRAFIDFAVERLRAADWLS
jgi:DNA-binding transcriptional LysR family regulator